MKGSFKVGSVEETWEVAKRFAASLRRGDVVCLEGDLGAGKTTFVQGLAAAMGVEGRVTSPTFCLVQEHRIPYKPCCEAATALVHMDLYRLRSEEDVVAIGWEDYVAEGAILVVEWPDRAGSLIPPDARRVRVTRLGDSDEARLIDIC